ncbi:ubiquitin-conjugating enzyme E2 Q2-like isoform X3 [Macaca nemestrina]|uniref:ubiquitin-conjugating enzyme E2 Q2-like isoform X3 n=1 Tax=Macaca nemestrina TaxID=9545 RepID=UPI0039B8288B
MSVSGFKAKLKLLASLPQEPGAQPPLTLHCNITNGTTEEVTSDEEEEEEEEMAEDIEDLDHYEMKEEPISGEKLEDEGIEKENLAILEKIRQDHLNVITFQLILHLFEWCYLFSQEGLKQCLLNRIGHCAKKCHLTQRQSQSAAWSKEGHLCMKAETRRLRVT